MGKGSPCDPFVVRTDGWRATGGSTVRTGYGTARERASVMRQRPPALYSPPMWKTIGMLSALCLAFIGLLIGLSLGGA